MKRALVLIMLTIFLLAGCTATKQQSISKEPENVDQGAGEVADVALEVIAQKLATPWSIDKVDNTFYVSERPGHIVKIVNGERQRQRVKLEKKSCDSVRGRFIRICSCSRLSAIESSICLLYVCRRHQTI